MEIFRTGVFFFFFPISLLLGSVTDGAPPSRKAGCPRAEEWTPREAGSCRGSRVPATFLPDTSRYATVAEEGFASSAPVVPVV